MAAVRVKYDSAPHVCSLLYPLLWKPSTRTPQSPPPPPEGPTEPASPPARWAMNNRLPGQLNGILCTLHTLKLILGCIQISRGITSGTTWQLKEMAWKRSHSRSPLKLPSSCWFQITAHLLRPISFFTLNTHSFSQGHIQAHVFYSKLSGVAKRQDSEDAGCRVNVWGDCLFSLPKNRGKQKVQNKDAPKEEKSFLI